MLDELRCALPSVEAHGGAAEDIPLPDGSFDAVVVGQAFHWFDPERALPEISRVLSPVGVIGFIWNIPHSGSGAFTVLSRIVGPLPERPPDVEHILNACAMFDRVEATEFTYCQTLSRRQLPALVASWSQVATLTAGERARRLADVEEASAAFASGDSVTLLYRTFAFRARKRHAAAD